MFCDYFKNNLCQSCNWIEKDYLSQIAEKEKRLKEVFNFCSSDVFKTSIVSPIQQFRNRIKMNVTGSFEDLKIGLVGKYDLDEGIDLVHCPIHYSQLNELMATIKKYIIDYKIMPYQMSDRKGELKGMIAFYSPVSNQMYLRFILRSKESISKLKEMIPFLQLEFPTLVCISANIQPIPHAILEGPEEIDLTQETYITHQIENIKMVWSPQAFVQTNFHVSSQLYKIASQWINELSQQARKIKMIELFCGQGVFSFFAAAYAYRILGIEVNPQAIVAAKKTAQSSEFSHLEFKSIDASQTESLIFEFSPDLILVNPPRKGLGESLKLIKNSRAKYLIYSSCSLESLEKDIHELLKEYQISKIQLFDMFPHTNHFETLILLEKKS